MTFRASYFTVQPQSYRPWDPAQPNYLVTVLSTVPTPRYFIPAPENRPAPSTPPRDFPFPNLVLLGVSPRPLVSRLAFDRPPPPLSPPADYPFPNIALLNFAQLQVEYVGTALDETIPLPRPRPLDFQFPNLLTTTLSVSYSPAVAVWAPGPLALLTRPDFLPPNLAVQAAAPVAKPAVVPIFEQPKAQWKPQDFPAPNIVISTRPFAAAAFLFDRRAVAPLPVDFQFPNIALLNFAQLQVKPVGAALDETVPVSWRPRDFLVPNLLTIQPPAVAPVSVPIFDRPVPVIRAQDTQFPNIALLNFAQLQVHPVGTALDETTPLLWRPRDFLAPNLLTIQPTAVAPVVNPIFDRPQPVLRQPDAQFANLAVLTPAAVKPPLALVFERPLPTGKVQDFQAPNIVVTAPPVAKPAVVPVSGDRPLPQQHPQDFAFPNIALAPPTFLLRAPLISRPVTVALVVDAPVPNLLTTTLAVVAKPPFNLTGIERPAPVPAPQDFQFPNLLTTTLFTPAGTPFVPNPFLFTDRPQPPAPAWDHPPANFLPLRPPPVVSVELHQNPFFITMGRLSQLGNLPS